MKDFRLFEITDFVMDEDFIRWVLEENPADDLFWNNWLHQNPDKHLVIAEAKRIVQTLRIDQEELPQTKVEAEIDRLLHTIQTHPQQLKKPNGRILRISSKCWYAAASVILIGLTGILYFGNRSPASKTHDPYKYTAQVSSLPLIENINTSKRHTNIALPDGSIIRLAPDSRVSYSNRFDSGTTRDVYLSGEAFFNVVKNSELPFRVFSNEIITKVLGTTFTVSSFDRDSIIKITVKSGKVSVYTQANKNVSKEVASKKLGGILLTSNQQLVYAKTAQTFQKIIADSPSVVVPGGILEKQMAYEDTPLETVFKHLSEAYGIEIIYDSELLKNCTVTADIRHETFYQQLNYVCQAVGAKYELMDGQVVIQLRSCQ